MKNSLLYTPQDLFAEARNEAEIDNLLNTDMYKILMLDFILAHPEYRDITVKRKMKIRNPDIKLANVIPQEALERQFEWTKQLTGISEADASYLRGMTDTSGQRQLREETLDYLKDMKLSDYTITPTDDGNYDIEFVGSWASTMLREIYALKIVNSLYLYYYTQKAELSTSEFNNIINETIHRLYEDIAIFQSEPELTFSEFGTRRGLSTDFHRLVFDVLQQELPDQCVGSSNIMISRELGNNNPKGTNAHELRMIPTALSDDPEEIVNIMYDIDRKRAKHFPDLAILLPDTYGTSYYLDHCPEDIIQSHVGNRIDSKDPHEAIPEYVEWLKKHNIDPQEKIAIPSDGLTASSSVDIYRTHKDTIGKISTGNGTHLTNNTKSTRPRESEPYGPFGSFSVVVKPTQVQRPDGTRVPCIKLSDNRNKITGIDEEGGPERAEFFKTIFGNEGRSTQDVLV